jgi:hypothetical protein
MTRTSHALAADGRVWLVDPVDWPDAIERARTLGELSGVLQLLDRHNRDCARLAQQLGVPHLVAPGEIPQSPFECIPLERMKLWTETALWWPQTRTLVVAEALGTNSFYTGGHAELGVHFLLRVKPPAVLAHVEPEHILVGHGEGVHGAAAAANLTHALKTSRRALPGVLLRLPFSGRS